MTATSNPTAEQILTDEWVLQADRAKAMTGMDAIWFPDAGETLAALRAHGLLSVGASSEEQIERATDEIRATYAWGCKNEGVPAEGAPEAEFDRWLAGVERASAARALEDAAEGLFILTMGPAHYFDAASAERLSRDWLRARAAEIREGKLS